MVPYKAYSAGTRVNKATNGQVTYVNAASTHKGLHLSNSGYLGPKIHPLIDNPHSFSYGAWELSLKYDRIRSDNLESQMGDFLSATTQPNGLFLPDLPSDANLYNATLSEFNEKARGSVDLSIDFAEAGRTRKMLNISGQLERYADDLRAWSWNRYSHSKGGSHLGDGILRGLKSVGGIWLVWTYGLRPLMNTVYGTAETIVKLGQNRTKQFRARRSEYVDVGRIGYYSATNPSALSYVTGKAKLKRSITIGANIQQDDFGLSRFTSMNPYSIAWERLPFSFVADWFIDIGGMLRNFETSLLYGSRSVSGYVTRLLAYDGLVGDVTKQEGSYTYYQRSYGSARLRSLDRSVLTQYPGARLPSFEADLGLSRYMSAASLLAQAIKR